MAFQSRFFRTTLPARTVASALGLLAVLGSPSGTSAQAPVVAPAVPVTAPATPVTAPAAPKIQAGAAPVPAIASTSRAAIHGAMQIANILASVARFDRDGKIAEKKIGFEIPDRAVNEYLAFSLRNRLRPG